MTALSYAAGGTPHGPWATYLDQIERVRPFLGHLEKWVETLKRPKRCLVVDIPIEMDDGSVSHFEGFRVQHNLSRGPGKGGVRYHPDVTLEEVMALAAWMTVKNAALNLPYGGAKGGVRCEPARLSMKELERVTRRYTSEIGIVIGPQQDIPAPDVNTNAQVMAWMMDTYSMNVGATATGVVTGKPIALGGSLGRVKATGRGVFVVGREASRRLGLPIDGARIAIQGFGNVGSSAAELYAANGAKVIAVQDASGTVLNEHGLDIRALMAHAEVRGGVAGFAGGDVIDASAFWDLETDVVIPAALEGVITAARARTLKTRMVLEGANGPTLPEADLILRERGITVVPDVIANAGGVTVSYFEWVQDFSSFFWTEEEINARLDKIMVGAFGRIWADAERHRVPLRTAAFVVACERVLSARELRGLYP
jgi:glutamate dehydrogenase (NAD(P)+)